MNVTAAWRRRRALHAVLVGYAVALLLVVGWPTPVDAELHGTLWDVLNRLHRHGLPDWIGYGEVEFLANIALFVPLGSLLAVELRRRPWWLAAVGGFGISLAAEVAQGLLRPERFATGWDVVANTLGALLGSAAAAALSRRRRAARERSALPAGPSAGTLLGGERVEEHDRADQVPAVDRAADADGHQGRIEHGGPLGR